MPVPAEVAVTFAIVSPLKSESRAGSSELYRTATSVCHSTIGTLGSQSASLVVAARPTAGRSPARARSALSQRKSCCPTEFSSGTLPVMKYGTPPLTPQVRMAGIAWLVARGLGGVASQSDSKAARCCVSHAGSATRARAATPKRHLTWRSSGRPKGRHSPLR